MSLFQKINTFLTDWILSCKIYRIIETRATQRTCLNKKQQKYQRPKNKRKKLSKRKKRNTKRKLRFQKRSYMRLLSPFVS